ncbi:VanZ family protein [Kineococcus rubinsiae]|uniref:VanZ family protein n=1 Tax=Kineococcus rubinsiae TaxID=2609562 RepID=UPI00142F401C|nr:VanZ family protein [Kineococcus rubinsiae]
MRRTAATVAFAGACLVSLVVLFAPSSGPAGTVPHLDKLVHAGVFGLLVATGVLRFGHPRAVLLAAAGYAVLSEVVQHVALPGRTGDPTDVVADCTGALLGLTVVLRATRRVRRSAAGQSPGASSR